MARRLRQDVFVGRADALSILEGAAATASARRARLALVEGPPGVGKTALVREFAGRLDTWRVLHAGGLEAESVVPFGVAAQLLRALGDDEPLGDAGAVAPSEDAIAVGGRLLVALGADADRPLAIVLDDAQWVDEPSIQAIAFAFRRLDADPVLVIAASRPHSGLGGSLERLAGGPRGAHLQLAGLDAADVGRLAALLGRPLSPAAARRLREHTDGLPLHAVALLRELDLAVLNRPTGPLPAPRSFATMVLQRVATLSPDAEALVEAAAVLGESATLPDAVTVAAVDDPVGALDEAVAASLLEHRHDAWGDELRFSHALVRTAVLDAVAPARRVALHLRCAEHLGGAAALEHRAAGTLVPDRDLAAELRCSGQEAVDRGAIDRGVRFFLQAARLEPDPAEQRKARLAALEALVWGGTLVAANTLAAELRDDLAAAEDDARALYVRGHLALLNGRRDECEELLLAAWERCDRDADPLLPSLVATRLAQLFNIFGMAARTADAVTWAERSFSLTPESPGTPRAPNGIVLVSLVLAGRADEALARALREEDTRAALAAGTFDDILGRGIVKLWTDDLGGARRDLATAAAPAGARAPFLPTWLWALGFLADAEYRAGLWDDSMANAEVGASLAEDSEHGWLLGVLHGVAALPYAARGEWESAAAHAEAARAMAQFANSATSLVYAAAAAATLAAAQQDHAGVIAATDEVVVLDPERGAREPGVFDWCSLRIEALVALGRLDEAEHLADEVEALARSRGRRSAAVALGRARGVLAAARGRDDEAAAAFERGANASADLGMPFLAAQLDLAHGSFLRRRGRRRLASGRLQAARDTFTALGARPYLERAEAELEACGLTPRRRGVQLPALTPREHAIARLVGDGLTNREIAERLVVSVKTVEYHLGNAFTKYGVRTRTELASRLSSTAPGTSPDD